MATKDETARHIKELEEELAKAKKELFELWRVWQQAVADGFRNERLQEVAIEAKQAADKWQTKVDELRGRITALKH